MSGSCTNTGDRSIEYGSKSIGYKLVRSDRKTMEIAVHPDCSVVVKAPVDSDIVLIENKVGKRARWILRQIDYFRQFHPRTPARCNLNGETHHYLGRQYRLRAELGPKDSVKLTRGFFQVTYRPDSGPDSVGKLLSQWYMEKARQQFLESLDRCWGRIDGDPSVRPRIQIRRMRRRWGSLSEKDTITLNSELIKAPRECLDYVVMHELCHLKIRNHCAEFYSLLESVVPDWKVIKHRLETSMS